MPTDHILTLLISERDRLNRAIEVLQGGTAIKRRGRPPKNLMVANGATAAAPAKKRTRTFTAAQRKKQAERMKAYWAGKKKKEARKG
jgi:hypothetical protein